MRAKSAMMRKPANIEAELTQQAQKSKILDEDRKNFHRQAEEIKQKNREEIEKLKSENEQLRLARDESMATRKQRRPLTATFQKSGLSTGCPTNNKDENHLRRILDKQRHITKSKKSALYSLQDKLKEVEESKLGFVEESPLMRTIRVLENRLDKVMIKYNEAQSVQKTYEVVVKRLREERVGYDNQLSIIESSLKGKEQDFEELLLLAHDATHAKEGAYAELKRFEQRRVTVQEMRSKYINDKKTEMNKDVPIFSEQVNKGEVKNTSERIQMPGGNSYQHDDQFQKQELSDYEEAFRKLKEVTGVIDANEIIQKFKTQGMTTASLEELRGSYKLKIEQLKHNKEQLKRELEENCLVKQRNVDEHRRIDQIEKETAQVSNQLERTSLKAGKLSQNIIDIKAGVQHLEKLTMFYKKEGEQDSCNTLQDSLKVLNDKLRRMYDIVKNDPHYMKRNYKANAQIIRNIFEDRQCDHLLIKKDQE